VNLLESYAEYYTNQEYGLLFWHRDENERFNLQNQSLSSRSILPLCLQQQAWAKNGLLKSASSYAWRLT